VTTTKSFARPKGAAHGPIEASASTLAEREAGVLAQEQAVVSREHGASRRELGVGQREKAAELREKAVEMREKAVERAERTAEQGEKALRSRRKAARAKELLGARLQGELREANEQLVVATVRAQTLTEAAEQTTAQMTHMAEHDVLTGLPNRALLADRLERAIAFAQRHGKKVALMYLDLDHFKRINDSLGHAIGDALLRSVAKRLRVSVRLSDTVSRQGGDEFMVLLAEVEDAENAAVIAEKLMNAMARPHVIGGHRLHVTPSIGISVYPDDGADVEAIVRNADTAMYHAKQMGRHTYQMFTPDMKALAISRQSVEQALHRALERRRFVLYYQPKVNLETGTITGAEALLRWQRTSRGLVHPTQFVSVAEDCGLILPLGKWVLREACRQARAWLLADLDLGLIAVNVSAVEFRSKDFLAGVLDILEDTGLSPQRLEIELTESGLMQDTRQTMSTLKTLKNLGVTIAIDDFGTGYSNLAYLQSFPIDELKIDQSFVQGIHGDAGGALVSAIIAIGASLKMRVVAEGVETHEQLTFLRSHHCTEGQGYYFGRPMAAEEFATLLATGRPA
jgi:diguanylate cyclase (GGDEF)-like protein